MTAQTLTAAQIVKTCLTAQYTIKSIRKNKDGDTKVSLDNKAEIFINGTTTTARFFMQNSRAHQIKAMSAWNHRNKFLGFKSSNDIPSTDGAVFIVKTYVTKISILMERMVRIQGFSPKAATQLGNQILSIKNPEWMTLMGIDSDPTLIREVAALQMRLGKI
jgi:hypothetical protein